MSIRHIPMILRCWLVGATLVTAVVPVAAADRYVSKTGLDTHPGTLAQPWLTIQKAVNSVVAGDTVHIRGNTGVYAERVNLFGKDGTAAQPIVFKTYEGDPRAVIDQSGVTPPNGESALLRIENCDHITIQNLELRNYKTVGTDLQQRQQTPAGIFITGDGNGIKLLDCSVHGIWQSSATLHNFNANALGIAVYGSASTPINGLVISGCEVYDLRTGASECVSLNGNVTAFTVANNQVHDGNNIGIDLIGYEGTNADVSKDRARDGVVSGNTVYNIDSRFNPAYGGNLVTGGGSPAAGGIYVDGGTNIVIERNRVYACNFGVELASESATGFCDFITLRNNLLHHNHVAGLIMGGYDSQRGATRSCLIGNNTFYENDTLNTFTGQIALQFFVSQCTFRNNIIWARGQTKQMIVHDPQDDEATLAQKEIGSGNAFTYNRYYCSPGSATNLEFVVFKNGLLRSFTTLSQWQTSANGIQADTTSAFGNPGLLTSTPPFFATASDFLLAANSTCIDAGMPSPPFVAGVQEKDILGQSRVASGRVDIGADEFMTPWQAWRDLYFALPDGGPQADATDDTEQDGATNLLEYSQGANPLLSDVHLLPAVSKVGGNLRLTYRKAVAGLVYTVQQSGSLPLGWTDLTSGEQTDGAGLFWREIPLGGSARFLRLQVTQP